MEGQKRKISVRKVLQLCVTVIVTTGCVLAMLSASRKQDTRTVQKLDIRILNERSCAFLNKAQLYDMLIGSRHIDINRTPVTALDIHAMEHIMLANPWVESAEVYVDNASVLRVNVRQRLPVLRVFEQNGNSYYLDRHLKTLPLSDEYTHYAPVVSNVPVLRNDSMSRNLRAQMVKLVSVISRDTFWSAQVAEIYMTNGGTFELVPVLGIHRIVIGDTSLLRRKLDNVFAFYRQVCNRIGWDKYQRIDASFKGQIVASPALKWNMPRDKALTDMNWVRTLMDRETRQEERTAVIAAVDKKPEPVVQQKETGPAQKSVAAVRAPEAKKTVKERPVAKTDAKRKEAKKNTAATADQGKQEKKTDREEQRKPKYLYQGN